MDNSPSETQIQPRKGWYEKGDYIAMIADEGRENGPQVRAAQLKVADEEMANTRLMIRGEDPSGHRERIATGPYLWTTTLFGFMEIAAMTAEEDGDDLVIAASGGGDSQGFGYYWRFNRIDEVYMTEDPQGSRVKIWG